MNENSKQLRRTNEGRMVTGVCSGVGAYTGIDPNILRVGLAVFTIFGGTGIALYALAWLLIPAEGADRSIAQDVIDKFQQSPTVQDAVAKSGDALRKKETTP